jgi:hypothetical protein
MFGFFMRWFGWGSGGGFPLGRCVPLVGRRSRVVTLTGARSRVVALTGKGRGCG